MTTVLSRSLPPPINWQDFERLTFDLFTVLWKTNDAEMHGRAGQPQLGVDVYGSDRVEKKRAGVQCKGKDQDYDGAVTEAELRAEVEKAKGFEPPLEVFTLVTTAPNDATIQAVARKITAEHAPIGLFEVRVQGWQTLRQRITSHPELVQKHFPDFAPVDVVAKVDEAVAVTEREGEATRTLIVQLSQQVTAIVPQASEADDPLKARIDAGVKLIEAGMLKAAQQVLETLWADEADRGTPRSRYRVLANLGNAHLALGDLDKATEYFERAHTEDPRWPGARAILATSQLLQGDLDGAYTLAREVLAEDPSVEQAFLVLIDAAPMNVSAAELEAMVSEDKRGTQTALLGLSLRARRQGDLAAAEGYARAAAERAPEDWRALSALGETLIGPIAAIEGIGFTHRVPPELEASFGEALELLRRSWSALKEREDAARGDHVAANLLTVLDVAGHAAEAEKVLDEALAVAPTYPPLLRRYAQRLAQAGDLASAAAALAKIPADETEPSDLLMQVQALIQTGKVDEALAETARLMEAFDDERNRQFAAAMHLEAASALGRLVEVLPPLLERWPESIIIRSVAIGTMDAADPTANRLAEELDGLVAGISDPRDRYHAAEALYRTKQFSKAADLLEGLHGFEHDHPALSRRIRALYFAERRSDARALFERLSPELQVTPGYARLGVAIYERSGMLPQARELLERWLETGEDLGVRLMWLQTVERAGEPETAKAWLEGVRPDQQGEPEDLMRLASAMDRHLGDKRSLPIAYRALRNGFEDPQVHLGYAIGLFLMGRVGNGEFPEPEVVEDDVVVTLEREDNRRRLTRIIETEPDPVLARDEIAPDHDLAIRLRGLKVGDAIELDVLAPEPARYLISELKNKYLFTHFRTLEQFPRLFPENRAFGTFEIDEAKGEEKFKPLFDSARQRHAMVEDLTKAYRNGQLPIAALAKVSGVSPLAVWESLRYRRDTDFNVALGVADEFTEAHRVIAENRRAVVDAVTLYGLVQLGVADKVKSAFDDLGVTQTTLDLLRNFRDDQQGDGAKERGTFGYDGEHYRLVELNAEMIEDAKSAAEAAVTFAEGLTILPAEAQEGFAPKAAEAFGLIDRSFLDTVLAAKGSGRVLLSDDRAIRTLATASAQVPTVWSQVACKDAAETGRMAGDDYLEVTISLAEARYAFTMVGHRDFIRELERGAWAVTPRLQRLIALLARPTNEQSSVRAVLGEVIRLAWVAKPSAAAFRETFRAIFEGMKATASDETVLAHVGAAVSSMIVAMAERARARVFRRVLLSGTSNRPPDGLFSDVEATARRVADKITDELSAAFAEATPQAAASPQA